MHCAMHIWPGAHEPREASSTIPCDVTRFPGPLNLSILLTTGSWELGLGMRLYTTNNIVESVDVIRYI